MPSEAIREVDGKKKVAAVLLAIVFVSSAGFGLVAKYATENNSNLAKSPAKALGTMDPGGLPHYFGPYANYANSPAPTGSIASITVDTGGSGYSAPVLDITDVWGTGSGATATATVSGGIIVGIVVNTGGTSYSAPIVTITDPTGAGAAATAALGSTLTGGIRKFVDSLPGLGAANANNLGKYISIAIPDTTTYPGCDYYEIALVRYTEKMHSDLPATLLNGYVQLETPAIASFSKHIALFNPDGSPIRKASGAQAIGVDNPQYLGPTIVATRDRPTRVTFDNLLPTGSGGNLFIPVDSTVMGAGMGPLDMIGMPGMKENYTENRATLHLHGGATPWISDGTPHQWTTPAGENTQYPKGVSVEYVPDMWFVNGTVVPNTVGVTDPPVAGASINPGNGSLTFYYTNQQSARLMFYHDHAYGITRLNVYSGEAAPYLLTDAVENELVNSGVIPSLAGEYLYGVPLVIQDKTFVDASTIAYQDPTWAWGSTPVTPHTGDLWSPHVYMPNQNPYDVSGANPYGRWDYGPWFFPPTTDILNGPVANPYYDPINAPLEPPIIPGVPKVSATMEAFQDTPVVNGQAYPYLNVEPQAYRFRILNAANDRFFNLQMYVADSNVVTSDGRRNTEVNMVPALTTPGFPASWPSDGRAGGVPNPANMGPSWVQIGSEGGFLPSPVVIPNQPVTWNYNMKQFNFGNIQNHSLLLGTAERADVIVDFSQFAGKTIIVYNDAPAGFPAYDPRSDYYTGDTDQTSGGGAPTTQAGYGPNTRTIMQIRVASHTPAPRFNIDALNAAFATTPGHLGVFASSEDPIIVPQAKYDSAYGRSFPADAFVRIQDTSMTFTTLQNTTMTLPLQPKAIHDEMGGSYDVVYGRMSGSLGLEVPSGNAQTQMFMPLGYASPPVDIVEISMTPMSPVLGDGTQIWKITHNGVDTHAMHWHLFNVQLINRVAWDNTMLVPDDNELGWKETVRVDPLSDTIIAMRPVALKLPWEVPTSIREIDPTLPDGALLLPPPGGFNDPNANPVTVTNHLVSYGWEYVFHCHLLEHEEMDMMHSMPIAVPPYSPRNLTGTLSGTAVNLTWTDNSIAETGYLVQRSSNSGPWTTIANLSSSLYTIGPTKGGLFHYNDTVAADGTIYSYRVLAITVVGDTFAYGAGIGFQSMMVNSTPSNEIRANTGNGIVTILTLPPPPGPPTPPAPPGPFVYRAPAPLVVPAASVSTSYVAHAPIRINSNADFNSANGVSGGSGTVGSPYIIENLRINGTGVGYGIYIGNTTSRFIVRNNYIEHASGAFNWSYSPDSGVVLNKVVNGVVAYNTLASNAWSGVYMRATQLVTVFNNTASKNYIGIYLRFSSNDTIASNNVSDSDSAMWLYRSDSNFITGNTLTRNYPGIVLAASNGATITNNSIYANGYYGVWLQGSGHSYIHDNDFVANHGAAATYSAAHVQAYDETGTTRWNTTTRGNHWSDWTGPDANHNGIVDVPYAIDGGTGAKDHFPLVAPIIPDLLTTVVVTPSPLSVILRSTQTFTAQGLSQYGTPITGLTFAWSTNVGVMTGNSLKTQAAVGTIGYVRATSGVVSGDAAITVILGPLARINVTPAVLNIPVAGYQLFTAVGMDAYYNNLTVLAFNWTTNVGTVTSFGLFNAQIVSVAGFVNASAGAVTGSASVTVSVGQLTHIVVTPGIASVAAGTSQAFTAVGYDQYNNTIAGLIFTWSTNIGTMTGATLTAQTTSGPTGLVTATSAFVTGIALITIVPAALDHINVTPAAVNVAAGSQTLFSAVGKDVYNNSMSGLTFSWTTTVGSVSAAGLFTAQTTPGVAGYVNASSGGKNGSAMVNIINVQTLNIVVTPATATVAAGATQAFVAVAYDQLNNLVPGVTFNWTTTVGTMTGNVLTAQTLAGASGYVRANNGSAFGQAFVTIVPGAPSHIDMSPLALNALVNSQTQFIANGKDAYNNVVTGLSFNWTTNVGTVTPLGLFTAQSTPATTGYVNASFAAVTGSASVNVIVNQLVRIVITPSPVNVSAGAVQGFSAAGYDFLNNLIPGAIFVWTTNLGTMIGSNLTAQTVAGVSGFVRASSGLTSADAFVTIVPGPLNHTDLTPVTLSAVAGSQTRFAAVGKDVFNNPIAGLTFIWTTTVGNISSSGLFTAQTLAGAIGSVKATSGLVTGTAVVDIVAGQLTHIVITPGTTSLAAGASQAFTAVGYDQFNNMLSGLIFTWTTNVGKMTANSLTAQNLSGASGYVQAAVGLVTGQASVTIVPGTLTHIDLTPSTLNVVAGSQAQFTAAGKDVHNNTISGLTFSWTTTVGSVSTSGLLTVASTGATTGFVNATSGLVVGSASVNVIVINSPPIVIPLANLTGTAGVALPVSGIAVDLDKDPLRFTWDFGDGTPMVVGQSRSHIYTIPGTYKYTLYVDDGTGLTGHNVSVFAKAAMAFILHLEPGWNMVSIPFVGSNYRASTLGLAGFDLVAGWNSSTQSYDQVYMVGFDPPQYDFQLNDSKGYWIWASAVENIALYGTQTSAPLSRVIDVPSGGGWVMVSLCSFQTSWMASGLQSLYTGGSIFIVGGWDAATQTSYAYLPGIDPPIYDFAMRAGHSYWIWVSASGTLTYTP